ncbi:MAG: ABC transporter ATP-binding protein [Chloroflexota bacterium]|nr:ABC transporter ATP-binding protein [Chloroflexota bacterium]
MTAETRPGLRSVGAGETPGEGPAYRLSDVIRVYREGEIETIALRGIDLEIPSGQFAAIIGRSGSGKSTLLNLLAAADRPTAGRVLFNGLDLARADEADRAALRGRRIGIVFQGQNLVPFLSLAENVELGAAIADRPAGRARIDELLDQVGLAGRARHRPEQLSGGEQQRAGLAAVLAAEPQVLLGDEITGELDTESAELVLAAVADAHEQRGVTVILVTHSPSVAERADRIVELRDGRIVGDASPARRTAQ